MYRIDQSKIQGQGVIANRPIKVNQLIDMGIQYQYGFLPYVTPHFGSYINHSSNPNTRLLYLNQPHGHAVISLHPIRVNEEVTIDYNKCPWYIMGSLPWYK
jgi:SET domain-containing protein